MLEGKEREPVFDRLHKRKAYEPRKNIDEPSVNLAPPEEAPTAQIQMHRGAPISVALYEMNKA